MVPTLKINDRVLVNKLSYRLHDVNRATSSCSSARRRGNDQVKDLIKRVIALPGESLVINDNKIYINGQQLAEPYLPAGTINTPGPGGATWTHKCTTDDPCVVPEGTVWVMGDNRTNSKDSRYIGPIPEDKIVGRAFVTVWPFDRIGGL
jgi:signal peptidase I